MHLNPKIGFDWMLPGVQKTVPTPGQNAKRYAAGALDERTGRILHCWGNKKDSGLFIDLLDHIRVAYAAQKAIHIILDNHSIHDSKLVRQWFEKPGRQRVNLHFLPPYCPQENKIELTWKHLHDNVTRNHTCSTIQQLCLNADRYLEQLNCCGNLAAPLKKAA